MGIGTKLELLLTTNDTNANELAKKIGVSPTTIYSIIRRNNKKVDIDVLLRIAEIFGVTAEYFVDDNTPKTIALHFDGAEYTEEELEEIKAFATFVRSKRTKATVTDFPLTELNAAHERTDIEITDDMKQYDDDIMDGDDF